MIAIDVRENLLTVKAPYELKEACKSILGARWSKALKVWTYPASPHSARNLEDGLARFRPIWSVDAAELLKAHDEITTAGVHKTADDGALSPIPITKKTPWLHQLRGYHFARSLDAVMLALEMRCGKTKLTIDLLQNEGWNRTLVICPPKVVAVWPTELEKHCAIPVYCVALEDGTIAARVKELETAWTLATLKTLPLVVVVNYEAAWREPMAEALVSRTWDCVVLDESHRIKAPGGRQSKFCANLAEHANKRICLTGTPLPHSRLDAYGQYRFLDKGVFGTSFACFRARYAIMGGYGGLEVKGFQREDEFNEKLHRIMYRVKADDVQDLPPVVEVVRPFKLSRKARAHYQEIKTDFLTEFADGTVTAGNALTRLLRFQQITSGFVKLDDGRIEPVDTGKAELLEEILEDLPAEEPVVVFARFHSDLDAIRAIAEKLRRGVCELSGRVDELKAWQQGRAPIIAVQIQSGSEGIELSRACHVVYYSLGFSLREYEQSRKRSHGPEQKRSVGYYHLIAAGTVDETVYEALKERKDAVEAVLGAAKKGTL